MDDRLKLALAVTGISVVAYSIGYHRAEKHFISVFGSNIAREASIYLATQDRIRYRGH